MTPPKKAAKTEPAAAPADVPSPPEKGIGGRIKKARQSKRNNLTIEALSRLSKLVDPDVQGMIPTTILRYEKGSVLPGAREIRILCDALNVTADWLVLGRELQGTAQVDEVLNVLSRVLKDKLTKEQPLGFMGDDGQRRRDELLAKAREPQPKA